MRFATQEHPAIVSVPEVVRVAVVSIEPELAIVIPLDIEHVEVAVRVGYIQNAIYATAP